MYYFGTNFTARYEKTLEGVYRCGSCNHSAPVWVIGRGEGVGHSVYNLNHDSAAARAQDEAISSAESDAEDMREFTGCASCPACGHVDRRSLALFWGRGAFFVAVAVGLFALMAVVLPMLDPGPVEVAQWTAKVGALASLLIIGRIQLTQWIGIRQRITFVDPRPPAPAKRKKKRRKVEEDDEEG
jgi:hypothetical protein